MFEWEHQRRVTFYTAQTAFEISKVKLFWVFLNQKGCGGLLFSWWRSAACLMKIQWKFLHLVQNINYTLEAPAMRLWVSSILFPVPRLGASSMVDTLHLSQMKKHNISFKDTWTPRMMCGLEQHHQSQKNIPQLVKVWGSRVELNENIWRKKTSHGFVHASVNHRQMIIHCETNMSFLKLSNNPTLVVLVYIFLFSISVVFAECWVFMFCFPAGLTNLLTILLSTLFSTQDRFLFFVFCFFLLG